MTDFSALKVTLTGTLLGQDGGPAGGLLLHLGAIVSVRPLRAGEANSDEAGPYPPLPAPATPFPDPILLFSPAPAAALVALADGGGGALLRRVITEEDGTFSIDFPIPNLLAYGAGARTDADLDPARGGRYSVQYVAVLPTGRMTLFPLDMTTAVEGVIDITALLSGPSL